MLKKWAHSGAQDCDSERTRYETSQDGKLGFECTQHDGCATGAEVVHCTWDGKHDWPQRGELRPGNDLIWEFFDKHRRSRYLPEGQGE